MLNERDMKAWRDLGRSSMTIKLVLSTLQSTLQRLENPHLYDSEGPDAYVLWNTRDAIRQCETCLAAIGEKPL